MIILDTETTGLVQPSVAGLAAQPSIIDFYALKVDLRDMSVVGELELLCKPPQPIDAVITKITGLSNADLDGLEPFGAHFDEVAQLFIGESEVVAHNCQFDMSLLEFEMQRIGKGFMFPWPVRRCCTVEATYHILNRRMKLTELYEHALGRPLEQKHRARADVEALWEVVQWMAREGMPL